MVDSRYYSQLSKFFTTSVLRDVAQKRNSSYINDTIRDSGLQFGGQVNTFRQLFDFTYAILGMRYRCEYVYKNSIANELLIKRHSLRESTLLSEFAIEECRADIVIVNGDATIYEIKTEYDSLARLTSQVPSYLRASPYVYVVAHRNHLPELQRTVPECVGIIMLNDNTTLTPYRNADYAPNLLDQGTIFDTLRRREYCNIIQQEFGEVPAVPNTRVYTECRALFAKLTPEVAYRHMVNALRLRNRAERFLQTVDGLPYSLKAACFQSSLTQSQWDDFRQSLEEVVPI